MKMKPTKRSDIKGASSIDVMSYILENIKTISSNIAVMTIYWLGIKGIG
jgi:hypothetical protein